jgi:hypothetical protein
MGWNNLSNFCELLGFNICGSFFVQYVIYGYHILFLKEKAKGINGKDSLKAKCSGTCL